MVFTNWIARPRNTFVNVATNLKYWIARPCNPIQTGTKIHIPPKEVPHCGFERILNLLKFVLRGLALIRRHMHTIEM